MTGSNNHPSVGGALSRRRLLGGAGLAAAAAGSGSLLTACAGGSSGGPGGGSGGGGGGDAGGAVTWGSWANPGEGERYKQYSKDYQAAHGAEVTWQQVVGDYQAKLLTQLAGGSAPDAFYVGDTSMAPLIASGKLVELSDFLAGPDSAITADSTFPGLLEWCKDADGGLYGVPVDCNPKVFWFNKGLLEEAGVTTNPAQAFEGGTWDQAALDDLLVKVKGTGKRGLVFESGWADLSSYITSFGGTAFDEEEAVFDTDPRAMEVIEWLFDHFAAETISYGGSLPKGQGVDALFYGGQLASCQYGRWILPNLKKLEDLQYDIAPLPSDTGDVIKPVAVFCAAMSVNTDAQDQQAALQFMSRFVSADGQRARLSGGGNAVASTAGLEEVVTEGGLPEHGAWFTEIASQGYAVPLPVARNAKVSTNLATEMDKSIKGGDDAKTFASKIAAYINSQG
ncbi:extracellular solute-binding protein [Auraticoccus monumenti]|uniref:Carbohydrate ABC transporter substrate-binding protein, CUT1 family n=1 Tax=Auraticoccus monumenti TaxID=675864 RepID=A0A1G7A523_9ACTN|nr:extracellular solute-binding protein [Auraticoccus monumenti]SDE09939.1 carbohydrate ABC transporter substrate-binding protein, CUT1 family [Auraticoccus monumenti]